MFSLSYIKYILVKKGFYGMIRKKSQFKHEVIHNMCGGAGDTLIDNAFSADEITSKVSACCTVTLEKGSSVGKHGHQTDDEIYYIISGKGSVDEGDGVRKPVEAGDAILTGNGGFHDIKNEGEAPLVFLAVIIDY